MLQVRKATQESRRLHQVRESDERLIEAKWAQCWTEPFPRNAIMEVFAVTIFMSLLFAVLFAVLFFAERSQRDRASIEQIALLPLDDGPAAKREPKP